MRSVAIFRHARSEGPGYFATYLARHSIPWRLVAIDAGEAPPRDARAFAGLAFMGGPMSVNDELPWIAQLLELIRDAVRQGVPTLGHCLGGQLIAKAFGAEITRNAVKEIGWGEVRVTDNGVSRAWLADLQAFEAFHWHGETFAVPPGATRVLEGAHCANQAFALGRHFGMQCHVEMTEELVEAWSRGGRREIEEAASSPGVQPVPEIERDLAARLDRLHRAADRIYDHWIGGLAKG